MTTSEQVNEIAGALAKAQGEMEGAVKDSANPFFKSKYADLASVWDACRKPLSSNGIAVVQSPSTDGARVTVDTMLLHTSGQWMRGSITVTAKDDSPQTVGSATTYLRRYSLQAFAGIAPEDDDAEAAEGRKAPVSVYQQTPKYSSPEVLIKEAQAAVEDGYRRGMETQPLTISRVDSGPTKNPKITRYVVHLSDGRQATTINKALGTRCKEYSDAGAEVDVVCHKGNYGLELDDVMSPIDPKATAEITVDSIPF